MRLHRAVTKKYSPEPILVSLNNVATSDDSDSIRLDQFLKLCGAVGTGGQAKVVIQSGEVLVNGVVEMRRRRKLVHGDTVTVDGEDYVIESTED